MNITKMANISNVTQFSIEYILSVVVFRLLFPSHPFCSFISVTPYQQLQIIRAAEFVHVALRPL